MPALLRSFGARNELELIDQREAPDSVDIYRLSCTSREERPQFLTVEVRADYMRCGHVVFTAGELLRDRVRASGFAAVAPAKEFVCHLLRCMDAGAIAASDGELLSRSGGSTRRASRSTSSASGAPIARAESFCAPQRRATGKLCTLACARCRARCVCAISSRRWCGFAKS